MTNQCSDAPLLRLPHHRSAICFVPIVSRGAAMSRAETTRTAWLQVLDKYCENRTAAGSDQYWSPRLDTASRDEIRAIQDAKLAAVTPFLYENSAFYRRRFDKLGLAPTDIRTVDDLPRWPPVDTAEMMADVTA